MKWQKKWDQLKRKNAAIFDLPHDDPIWSDEEFWRVKWPSLIDREAEALERMSHENSRMAHRS